MKILCFLPNYIGDVLMVTPALRVLKKYIRDSYITIIIRPELVELLDKNTNVDNIIVKNNRWFLIKDILKFSADYVVLFRTTFFNSLVSYLSKAKFSVGIDEECSKFFLKSTIKKDISRSYRCESILLSKKLLDHLKINSQEDLVIEAKKLDLCGYDNMDVKVSLEKKILEFGLENKEFIVISPLSTRMTKMLFVQQYIYLIKKLLEETKGKYYLILTSSKDNIDFINLITKSLNTPKVKSLAGKLSLKELAYLFSISKLVITPDSGPAYISESVGAKTVVFFTSTLPERYGPFAENVRLIYNPVVCSPCYKDICKKYICLKSFPLDKLIKISLDFLEK